MFETNESDPASGAALVVYVRGEFVGQAVPDAPPDGGAPFGLSGTA